ncbi:helix-turn-helix domain-containing protein [Desulfofarcimen acetoxidans]
MNKTGKAYLSQEKIANTLSMTRKTVNNHIASLLKYKWQDK